jgi:hypothetical protein
MKSKFWLNVLKHIVSFCWIWIFQRFTLITRMNYFWVNGQSKQIGTIYMCVFYYRSGTRLIQLNACMFLRLNEIFINHDLLQYRILWFCEKSMNFNWYTSNFKDGNVHNVLNEKMKWNFQELEETPLPLSFYHCMTEQGRQSQLPTDFPKWIDMISCTNPFKHSFR